MALYGATRTKEPTMLETIALAIAGANAALFSLCAIGAARSR